MRLATEAIMLLSISPVIIFHVSSRKLHEAFFLSVQDNGKQFYTQGLLKKCSITLGSFDFCLAIFITHIKIQFLLFLMKSVSVLLRRKDRKLERNYPVLSFLPLSFYSVFLSLALGGEKQATLLPYASTFTSVSPLSILLRYN